MNIYRSFKTISIYIDMDDLVSNKVEITGKSNPPLYMHNLKGMFP